MSREQGISRNLATRLALLVLLGVYLYAASGVLRHRSGSETLDGRTVIRFAHWQIEGGLREAMDAMADAYMESNPGTEVRQLAIPGNIYTQWLRTQLIGGTAPDLIVMGFWLSGVEELIPQYFHPITAWAEKPNPHNVGTPLEGIAWKDTIVDGMQSNEAYNKQLRNYYAATICVVTVRMFYNRDLMVAITGSDDPPQNLQEFLRLMEQSRAYARQTGRDIVPIAGSRFNARWVLNPLHNGITTRLSLEMDRYHRARYTLFEQATYFFEGDWDFHTPDIYRGLDLLRLIGNEMKPGFLQLERDDGVQQFLRQQAFMISTGSWDVGSLALQAPFEIGIFPIPIPERDDPDFGDMVLGPMADAGINTAVPFFVNNRSPHLERAIDYLQFMSSYPGNTIFARESGWVPSVIGVEPPESARAFMVNLEGYHLGNQYAFWPSAEGLRMWMTNLHLLFGSQGSTERFARALQAESDRAFRADVDMTLRIYNQQWRRQDPAIAAWRQVEGQAPDFRSPAADEQMSGQHLTEARAYLMQRAMGRR